MQFSNFGKKFSSNAGIVQLMDDLGDALRNNPKMLFMGGGNPAQIPEMELAFTQALEKVMSHSREVKQLLGVYQPPQGDVEVLDACAQLLCNAYGWKVTRENLAFSNGSQSAFFVLFNLFAGIDESGIKKHIQLPIAPEYLGYADLGLTSDFFHASKPSIEYLEDETFGDKFFKYHVDFSRLEINESTAALCVSRPTNPTGNVLTDSEMCQLDQLAQAHQIPFIIDGAYGTPFPNIIFVDAKPGWNQNTILVLSLSKLGLPGARTGIVVAAPEIIQAFSRANTILNLACGNFGPALAKHLFADEQILHLSRKVVAPFYRERMENAVRIFKRELTDLPYLIHKPEGAIFLWIWFKDLPITSEVLYQRLKTLGVLVISGHHFFMGLQEPWQHSNECIRVTYCQDMKVVELGAQIIAKEVRKIYSEN